LLKANADFNAATYPTRLPIFRTLALRSSCMHYSAA
jgi:hypothetical protein